MHQFKALAMASMVSVVFAALACTPEDSTPGSSTNTETESSFASSSMEPFSSDAEFEAFMEEWSEERQDMYDDYGNSDEGMSADADSSAEGDAGDAAAPAENEDITNNQEEGVDEGGIVKNVGDFLVVLRRGALYTVDVAESGETQQVDALRVAADEGLNQGVWYDEMLVRHDQIYVIGYRYGARVVGEEEGNVPNWMFGATEVSSFAIDNDGHLTRGDSTFFESNDYYSGSNYASRLVDGELIFYMPYSARFNGDEQIMPDFPTFLHHESDNDFTVGEPLFGPTDIIKPFEMPGWPTFHTVIQCELPDDLSIDCSARSLLSDWGRQFYVSPERIYLWSQDHVFALSQTTDEVAAHAVQGSPRDQFSFREDQKTLHIGVTRRLEEEELDEMGLDIDDYNWNLPQFLDVLSLPLADFDSEGGQSLDGKVQPVDKITGSVWQMNNRHVNGWYLASVGEDLYAHHLRTGKTTEFELDGRVSRIEATPGIGALIVYNKQGEDFGSGDLVLDSLLLGDEAELVDGTVLEQMSEGESRSHGFFFRPDDDGGLFGLPVLGGGSSNGWWGSGVSNIGFFRANPAGEIEFHGAVSSSDDADGQCQTSCTDWYGNTRPIFLFGRIYALMGSEIAEVAVTDDGAESVSDHVILTIDE